MKHKNLEQKNDNLIIQERIGWSLEYCDLKGSMEERSGTVGGFRGSLYSVFHPWQFFGFSRQTGRRPGQKHDEDGHIGGKNKFAH